MRKPIKANPVLQWALLFVMIFSGCTTTTSLSISELSSGRAAADKDSKVSVVLFNGQRREGHITLIDKDHLELDMPKRQSSERIALADINRIERTEFDGLRTLGLTAIIIVSVIAVAIAVEGVPIGFPGPPVL